jgi:hypothetical protein
MNRQIPILLAVGLALAFTTGAIDERTLECEQAVVHARDCCPNLEVPSVCGDGCSPVTLDLDESLCVQSLSCDDMRARGTCARLETASGKAHSPSDGQGAGGQGAGGQNADGQNADTSGTRQVVCP